MKHLSLKKLAAATAIALLVACLLPAAAFGATVVDSGSCGDQGGNVTWTLDSDGLLTIKGTGKMADWESGHNAPWEDSKQWSVHVKSVVVEEGVKSIGDYAFCGCESLKSVTLPEGVKSIGDYAFFYCASLKSVTIPEGVKSIGDYAFYYCVSLKSATIPEGVTSIGEHAYYECKSLTSVTIPSGVKSIGDAAFSCCSSLESFSVNPGSNSYKTDGRSLVSVGGEFVSYACASGESYSIPEGVTSIGNYAFCGSNSLKSVTIPSSVQSIGASAFLNCKSLASVTIPSGVSSIGSYAFGWCTALKSVSIPEGVTSIGKYAFCNLAKVSRITVSSEVAYDTLTGKSASDYVDTSRTTVVVDLSACKVTLPYAYTVYTGKAKKPAVTVKLGSTAILADAYTVSYKNNVKVGTATVTVTAVEGGACCGSATATFAIKPKPEGFIVSKVTAAVNYNGTITKAAYPIKSVTGAKGPLEYAKVSGSEHLTITKVGKTTGKVTVAPRTPVGTYQMVMRITDTATGFSKDVTVSVKVARFAPTISVAKRICAVSHSKTKDQVVEPITQVVCVSKPMEFRFVKALDEGGYSKTSRFSVDASTGAVTVKADTPKGTYRVQVKVLSKDTPNYKQNWKIVTCKIVVK